MDLEGHLTQDRLADRAVGVEQQLIELVARRETLDVADRPARLDVEIEALQDELGDLGEMVASDQLEDRGA